jgi:anti-sigma factor RsiW
MNCERYDAQLIAYMDGRASESERAEVEAHLAVCAACRGRAEEFRALWGVLDESAAHEVSPAFDARLRERIAAEGKPSWFAWLIPQPRLAFALSLLLVLGVWLGTVRQEPVIVTSADIKQVEEEVQKMKDVLEDYEKLNTLELSLDLPQTPRESPRKL